MEAVRFLTDEERVRFLSRAESRSYEPDQVILAEGDYNEDIFILVGGKARVDKHLDTGAKKFLSNNVFVDYHAGNVFSGLSYARLNAPGRFYTQPFGSSSGVSSPVSDFNQIRMLLGYGAPTKRGLGVAANVGLDLRLSTVQYGTLQASYNWDCCGFSVEYRKYELGSVRNENVYRFNITLEFRTVAAADAAAKANAAHKPGVGKNAPDAGNP